MSTSAAHKAQLVAQRQLLVQLLPRLVTCGDDEAFGGVLAFAEYQLRHHSFLEPFPADVRSACGDLRHSLERHSQQRKAAALADICGACVLSHLRASQPAAKPVPNAGASFAQAAGAECCRGRARRR